MRVIKASSASSMLPESVRTMRVNLTPRAPESSREHQRAPSQADWDGSQSQPSQLNQPSQSSHPAKSCLERLKLVGAAWNCLELLGAPWNPRAACGCLELPGAARSYPGAAWNFRDPSKPHRAHESPRREPQRVPERAPQSIREPQRGPGRCSLEGAKNIMHEAMYAFPAIFILFEK